MQSRWTAFLGAVVLLLPTQLAAERTERSLPASADTLIEIQNQTGRVRVHGWDRPLLHVVAERRSRATEVHFEQTANRVHVHTHILQADLAASERTVDYEIWMPLDASLDLHVDAGQVEVEGLRDGIEIQTVAAPVILRDVVGMVEVTTTSGDVTLTRSGGRLQVKSVSGNLTFVDVPGRFLTARTASGDIRFEGELLGGGSYEFSNHQGAIELLLPPDSSFELTAHSVQGEVTSSFSLKPKSHGRLPTPSYSRSLLGTVQSGAALVRASTFNGRIVIGKR